MDQPSLPFSTGTHDRKTLRHRAITAIGQHLAQGESKNWKSLRSRFPDVPERTWWRWIAFAKKAKSKGQMTTAARYSESPSTGIQALDSENRHEFVRRQMRAADFTGMMVRQMRDIDLLQAYAMTEDGKIKIPAVFERALALRERHMSSFIKTLTPVVGQLEWESLTDAVVDTVAAIDKDVAAQIIKALRDVQRQHGHAAG